MIVNVHRDGGSKLPENRAELYGEICQVVLWRRLEAKRLATRLDGAAKEAVLRSLAYAMMRRQLRELVRDDVLAEIELPLERVSGKVTAEEFLADMVLMACWSNGRAVNIVSRITPSRNILPRRISVMRN